MSDLGRKNRVGGLGLRKLLKKVDRWRSRERKKTQGCTNERIEIRMDENLCKGSKSGDPPISLPEKANRPGRLSSRDWKMGNPGKEERGVGKRFWGGAEKGRRATMGGWGFLVGRGKNFFCGSLTSGGGGRRKESNRDDGKIRKEKRKSAEKERH